MNKEQAIEAVTELLVDHFAVSMPEADLRESATKLVEIGMRVCQINWTPQQRDVADAALVKRKGELKRKGGL